MAPIPEQYRHLTDAPLIAHLATVLPDGSVQSNPMRFLVAGDEVRFTHTRSRQKFKNLQSNPTMSLSIVDPAQPLKYVELQNRYGNPTEFAPPDAAERVILRMAIDEVTGRA